ncbi:phosphatidylglycerol lysyltransferase domain-containing protein [Saccharicrinis sp. FJH54]|uniref:phosphatidylglycerol lysyltransferase domain-containing protein n=1 Tax=Saccharicrinis sp. FJH54 TaxID=3344665 RepID=UPI0035D40B7B
MTFDNLEILKRRYEFSFTNREFYNIQSSRFSESSLYNLFLFRKTYKYVLSLRWPDSLEGVTRYNQKFVIPLNLDPDFISSYAHDILNNGFGLYPLSKYQVEDLLKNISEANLKVYQHRDQSDYLYRKEDFLNASGKKYEKQRYYVNKLQRDYNVTFKSLSEINVSDVNACLEIWKKQVDTGYIMDYHECVEGIDMVLEGLLKGYCIYLNGKLESFIIYDDTLSDMSVALFQKSNHNYQGLTDYCYRIYCEHDITSIYFNLCQDLGIPGLRKKKLLMHPVAILDKYLVLPT